MTTSRNIETVADEEFALAEAAAIKMDLNEAAEHLPELIEAAHRGELVYILTNEEFGNQSILLAAIGRKVSDSNNEQASTIEEHIEAPDHAMTRD